MVSLSQLGGWGLGGTSLWLNATSAALAVLVVALAAVVYIRTRKGKSLCYAVRSVNVIEDLIGRGEALQLLHSGQRLDSLVVTKIAVWNGGRDRISGQDITPSDPLSIRSKAGNQILGARILSATSPVNRLSLVTTDSQSEIRLDFDHLAKNEGAVIQLVHTGRSGEGIEICGAINGMGRIACKSRMFRADASNAASVGSFDSVRLILGGVVTGIILSFLIYRFLHRPPDYVDLTLFFAGIFAASISTDFVISRRRMPKGLAEFEREF